jgi:hypothetical protein
MKSDDLSRSVIFVNSIVEGDACNNFGYNQYVSNSDTSNAYNVTIKVEVFTYGRGTQISQKVVNVAAGGRTYLGCSRIGSEQITEVTYSVVGESIDNG